MNNSGESPVWFITGCSRGLGLALAVAALERGDRVVATARNRDTLAALAAAHPDRCRAFALDVTKPEEVTAAIEGGRAAFGRLDVIVNNAGAGLIGALEECSEAQIAANFDVNYFGALRVIRAALPGLRAQKSGHVICVSAAAAIANYPGFGVYGAAKRALEGSAEALAAEGRAFGLKVTIVQPGAFRTDFFTRSVTGPAERVADYDATSGKFQRYLETIDGKQPGDPALVAAAIVAAVRAERPPLRLVLGAYANDKARRTMTTAQRELDAWATIAVATDFKPAAG